MDVHISEGEVCKELWREYKKTSDYLHDARAAIPAHHSIVERREARGLEQVIRKYIIKGLESDRNARDEVKDRTIGEWLDEWRGMHKTLFKFVYKPKLIGGFREREVRFGDPGDELLHRIPLPMEVPRCLSELVCTIRDCLRVEYDELEEKCRVLARVHYEFVRIHPFMDGNGRIARVITDQLAVYYGLPPAVAGYPRHDANRRKNYHRAIHSCVDDSTCGSLALWIQSYIKIQLENIA